MLREASVHHLPSLALHRHQIVYCPDDMPAGTILRALGAPLVHRVGDPTPLITQPRRVALLSFLALARPRGLHARDTLLAMFWPESDTAAARQALRNALHGLRRPLGESAVVTAGHHLVGVDSELVQCDVHEFAAHLDAGRVEVALRMWAEPLDGFHVSGAPMFEQWLDTERAAIREHVRRGVLRAAHQYAAAGDKAAASSILAAALEHFPLDEVFLRAQIAMLAESGDLRGAVRRYRAFVAQLAKDDGGGPEPATSALVAGLTADLAARDEARAHTTVAVLPFQDLTPDAAWGDVAAILADGVGRRLLQAGGYRLIAGSVIARAMHHSSDPEVVGRSVGADLVIEGTVRPTTEDGVAEVVANVVRAADAVLLHTVRLRSHVRRLLRLEGALMSALAPAFREEPETLLTHHEQPATRDESAYVLYVRGTWLFLRSAHPGARPEDLHAARELFEEAIALDPTFADAYAGLSNYYAAGAARNILRPFDDHFRHAIELSHRALALNPELAIPHVHFGVRALYLESSWDDARRSFERAVALDPRYAEARRFLGIVYGATGRRAEGLSQLREAVRLEPHVPMFRNSLADALMVDGQHDSAITELQMALAIDPSYRAARERLVRCREHLRQYQLAADVRRDAGDASFAEAFVKDGEAGYLQARTHELRQQIETLLARAGRTGIQHPADLFNPPELQLALAYAELGAWEEVYAWQSAAVTHEPGLAVWFQARPELARAASRD